MRLLVIDAASGFRAQCEGFIANRWPGAAIDTYAPATADAEVPRFAWVSYDAVLLDMHLGHALRAGIVLPPTVTPAPAESSGSFALLPHGLRWLEAWHANGGEDNPPPPVIMLSATTSEDMAVRAMKLGAMDYLRKDRVTANRLIAAIQDALLTRARDNDRASHASARLRVLEARAQQGMPQGRAANDFRSTFADAGDHTIQLGAAARPFADTGPRDFSNRLDTLTDAPLIRGYTLRKLLGEGGSARVYLARSERDQRDLVLKILHPEIARNDQFLERFMREYRVLTDLQNEHVALIYDQGITDDAVFIAMEYFPLGDLKQRIEDPDQPALTSIEAIRLTGQIARALDAVHGAGVVHRDLKPHNIMMRSKTRLALVDFGLAKRVRDHTITRTGALMATPLYMSPEQCLGRPMDHRSDLYSLGVILYQLLTGLRLFDSDNLATVAFQHVHADIPQLPPKLQGYQGVLERLLAKNPDDRFQSAREVFAHIAL